MRAIAYTRVSSLKQVENGQSLEAQEAKIRAYCEFKCIELIGVISDKGISGAKVNREGFQGVISLCKKGEVDSVIVYSISRFTRSTKDLLNFIDTYVKKKSIILHSLSENLDTSTATGRFMLKVMGAMNELEREQAGERTQAVMAYKKEKGEKTGGDVPYGYDLAPDGVSLIVNEEEQKAISLIKRLKNKGRSLRKICLELTKKGYTPNGQTWHPQTISNIFRRAA